MKKLIVVLLFLIIGCGSDDNPIVTPPAPLTGKWDVVFTGTQSSFNGIMDLTEKGDSVYASVTFLGETFSFSGLLSKQGQMTLESIAVENNYYIFSGSANSQKTSITGQLNYYQIQPPENLGYLGVVATKR